MSREGWHSYKLPTHNYQKGTLLSRREQEIVELMCEGHRHKEIAGRLGLAVSTVKVYVSRQILPKLGCHSTLEAVSQVLRERMSDAYFSMPGGSEGAD